METTRGSLLRMVKEGDPLAWEEFYVTYRPLVWLRGRDFGLNYHEHEELLQGVMCNFFNAQKTFTYDREKGRFRDYFRMVISNHAKRILKERSKNHKKVEIEKMPSEYEFDGKEEQDWNAEWETFVLSQALEEARQTLPPHLMQIFELVVIQEIRPEKVARLLEISLATVYNHRKIVLRELKRIAYELDAGDYL